MVKPKAYEHLTPAEVAFFLEHGYLIVHNAFSRENAARFTRDLWARLGIDPADPRTWPADRERVHMPAHTAERVETFAPRVWEVMKELLGGEARIDAAASAWGDAFIVNFGPPPFSPPSASSPAPTPASAPAPAPAPTPPPAPTLDPRTLDNWHIDGDFFVHFLDSPEQGLLAIPVFSDILPGGGATYIAPDSIPRVARFLARHPQGVLPIPHDRLTPVSAVGDNVGDASDVGDTGADGVGDDVDDAVPVDDAAPVDDAVADGTSVAAQAAAPSGPASPPARSFPASSPFPSPAPAPEREQDPDIEIWEHNAQARACTRFVELTARTGDVVLLHPLMLHSASPNLRAPRVPRVIANPRVALAAPFCFSRARGGAGAGVGADSGMGMGSGAGNDAGKDTSTDTDTGTGTTTDDGGEYSLVELVTLRALGADERRGGLAGWVRTGARRALVPPRVAEEERMRAEEVRRLAEARSCDPPSKRGAAPAPEPLTSTSGPWT